MRTALTGDVSFILLTLLFPLLRSLIPTFRIIVSLNFCNSLEVGKLASLTTFCSREVSIPGRGTIIACFQVGPFAQLQRTTTGFEHADVERDQIRDRRPGLHAEGWYLRKSCEGFCRSMLGHSGHDKLRESGDHCIFSSGLFVGSYHLGDYEEGKVSTSHLDSQVRLRSKY